MNENINSSSKKKSPIIVIAIIIIIGIVIGAVYFTMFRRLSAKQVADYTIANLFNKTDKLESKLEDTLVLDYKKDVISSYGTIKANIETEDKTIKDELGNFKNAEIDYSLIVNAKDLEGSLELATNQDGKKIIDANAFLKEKVLYVTSNLFSNPYKYDLKDEIDWDSIKVEDLPEVNNIQFKKIMDKTEKYVKDAIKEEYLSQKQGKFEVEGITYNGLETTLTLTEKRIYEISNNVCNAMLKDDEYIKLLADASTKKESEIKDELKDIIDNNKEQMEDASEDKKELKIYTTNSGKFLALTYLYEDDGKQGITATSKENIITIKYYEDDKVNQTFEYNTKTNELSFTVGKGSEAQKYTIKFNDDSIEVTVKYSDYKINLKFEYKTSKDNIKSDLDMDLNYNDDGKKTSINFNFDNTTKKEEKIKTFDTKQAKNIDEITSDEVENIESKFTNSIKGTYIESISNIISSYSSAKNYTAVNYDN